MTAKLDERFINASQSPQASQIPVLNSSGQLWLPFTQTPILVNGQDMMHRTFYVDAENGDDNNDGSESAPFRTIKKACDSVSVGGSGLIYLYGGQTHLIDSNITLTNKRIRLSGRDSGDPSIIQNVAYLDANNNCATRGFHLNNSQLCFYTNIVIQTANYPTGAEGLSMDEGLIRRTDLSFGSIQFQNITIQLGDTDLIRLPAGPSTLFVDFWSGSISRTGPNRDALVVYNEGGIFGLGAASVNIGSLSWSDLVSGVVRDANGVPRNVISNKVL